MGYMFYTRSARSPTHVKPPSTSPQGSIRVFRAPQSSFRSEEGWEAPHYPRWATNDVPRELLAGKSKWISETHLIGVSLRPYGHI